MLIRTAIVLIAIASCADGIPLPPPDAHPTVETVERPDGCEHRGFSCNPRDPDANDGCSARCNETPMHCQEYTADMLWWCDLYPGTFYRGNPNMHCSGGLPGQRWTGDPVWNMPCLPGWEP